MEKSETDENIKSFEENELATMGKGEENQENEEE